MRRCYIAYYDYESQSSIRSFAIDSVIWSSRQLRGFGDGVTLKDFAKCDWDRNLPDHIWSYRRW
jgi:hypothetical protein